MRTDRKTRTSNTIGVNSRRHRLVVAALGALFIAMSFVHAANAQAPAVPVPSQPLAPAATAPGPQPAALRPMQSPAPAAQPGSPLAPQAQLRPRRPLPHLQCPAPHRTRRPPRRARRAHGGARCARQRPINQRRSVAATVVLHPHVFGRRLGRQSSDDRACLRLARDLDGVARQDLGISKSAPASAPRRANAARCANPGLRP